MNLKLYTINNRLILQDGYEIFLYQHLQKPDVHVYVIYDTNTCIAYSSPEANIIAICKFSPITSTNIFGIKTTQYHQIDTQCSITSIFELLKYKRAHYVIHHNKDTLLITFDIADKSKHFLLTVDNELTHIFNMVRCPTRTFLERAQTEFKLHDKMTQIYIGILIPHSSFGKHDTLWTAIKKQEKKVNSEILAMSALRDV